jgi:hypothetical protein
VNDVEVAASIPRVRQATSFNDCCGSCEPQDLEALVPVPQGTPKRVESDGGLPLRRKFCGTVAKYGVNDETEDPRDIMINILPAPLSPYRDFLTGFVNTEQTRLKGDNLKRFGPSATNFNLQDCLDTAKVTSGKVIHAEVTPDEHFYGADARFLPIASSLVPCGFNPKCLKCIDGWGCESELEPSDRRVGAEVCVYGVYAYDHGDEHRASSHNALCRVLDTDHDHPEMHPFDAIWWRHPERTGWMFGVFQDDSNRYSFPHCGDNNGNEWSQAPRDLTFRFPFRFPLRSAPQHACLRHVRSRKLRDNSPNTVRPLNVTTGAFVNPATEALVLNLGGKRVLEVTKESGTGQETHVRVEGRIVGDDVVGQIILRVAIGCDERSGVRCGRFAKPSDTFNALKTGNQLVTYDKGDPGAGYFYAELTFECNCPSR